MKKKLLTGIMAIILALGLCACGNGDSNGGGNGDATTNLEDVKELNIVDLMKSAEQNEVRTNEEYSGKTVIISAFVDDIESDECVFVIYDEKMYTPCVVKASLSQEDTKKLNMNERINVVGTVKEVSSGNKTVLYLKDASVLDNMTTIKGKVVSLLYNNVADKYPSYCTVMIDGFFDGIVPVYCDVYMDGEVLNNLKEEDIITVKGNLFAYDSKNVHLYYEQKILGKLENAELVEE